MQEFSHSLPMMLYRTLDTVMPRFRQIFSEFGLTEQQWRVLRVLWQHEQIAFRELAGLPLAGRLHKHVSPVRNGAATPGETTFSQAIDHANKAWRRNQGQVRQFAERDLLVLPEHPEHPPLLFGESELAEYLPKPGHHCVQRPVKHHW